MSFVTHPRREIIRKEQILWDGDGVQGAGQPRDRHGRWVALPGPSMTDLIGLFDAGDSWEVRAKERGGTTKTIKRFSKTAQGKSAGNKLVARKIREDADQYKRNRDRNSRVRRKMKPEREAHQQAQEAAHERSMGSVAQRAKELAMNSLRSLGDTTPTRGSELAAAGKKGSVVRGGTQATRVKRSPLERLENPGVPTDANYRSANNWAKQNLKPNEAKYAELVARLLKNKKITQDPKMRGDLSERYDIPASRLVQIEQEMYDHLVPPKKTVAVPRKRNLGGGLTAISDRQTAGMLEHGALKAVAFGNTHRPERMFKATKGPHKGKFVVADYQGNVSPVSDTQAQKIIGDANAAHARRLAEQQKRSAKYRAEQKAIGEISESDREAKKAAKIKNARSWAESMGLDPDDSYWWAVYNNDNSLLESSKKTDSDPISDKGNWVGGQNAGTRVAQEEKDEGAPTTRRRRVVRRSKPKAEPVEEFEDEEVTPHPRRTVRVPKGTPGAKPRAKSPRKTGTTGRRGGTAPKRTPLVFTEQRGLPLEPGKAKGKYVPEHRTSDRGKKLHVKKAGKDDLIRLFGIDPKTGEPKSTPKGHVNIRVPLGDKHATGLGSFDYIYDHEYVKDRGSTVIGNKKKYTAEHTRLAAVAKFKRITNMGKKMPELDAKIKRDLTKDESAGAVAMMRILAMRPSSDAGGETKLPLKDKNGELMRDAQGGILYGEGIPTFGVLSMQRQHVSFEGNKAVISLTGKSAHEITIKTDDPTIVALLKHQLKKKGKPTDRLFSQANNAKVSSFLKDVIPDAAPKDMRTYVATEIARKMIAEMEPPKNLAEFRNKVKDVTETTANQLQHAPTMSLKSYVAPSVFMAWALTIGLDYDSFEEWPERPMHLLDDREKFLEKKRKAQQNKESLIEEYMNRRRK